MPIISEELIIDAPIEVVWEILTDFSHYQTWNPMVRNIVLEGGLQAGSKVTLHALMKPGGEPTPVGAVLMEVRAPHVLSWRGGVGPEWFARGYHFHQLESLSGGRTRLTHGEKFSGVLFALIWPLQRKAMERSYKEISAALEQRCSVVSSCSSA